MKHLLALAPIVALLSACADKNIDAVKGMQFDPNSMYTLGATFSSRSICENGKWVNETRDNKEIVEHHCPIRGTQSYFSQVYFNALKSSKADSLGHLLVSDIIEIFQWTITPNGPELTFSGLKYIYDSGETESLSFVSHSHAMHLAQNFELLTAEEYFNNAHLSR